MAILGYTLRQCNNCKKEYLADNRNLKRGWGLCCSKSCAALNRSNNSLRRLKASTPKASPRKENYYTMLGYNYDGSTFIDEMNGCFSNEDN
jgi:hypothetical protein